MAEGSAPLAQTEDPGAGRAMLPQLARPTIAVQVVLYGHSARSITTLVRSIERAAAYGRERGTIGAVTFLIGDSSPEACLTPETVSALREPVLGGPPLDLHYRYFAANRGSAGGNNDLFGDSQSDLVLIINPDCYASPTLLFRLCEGMNDPNVGIVEGRQLPLEHPKQFDRRTGDTSWASGSCMLIRRPVIDLLGGFDETSFFLYCDDVDFSWRTRLAGHRVVYQPSACVFHDKRLDRQGQIVAGEAEVYYSAEASLMMAWKWSKPEIVQWNRANLLRSASPLQRKAVEVFDGRRATGQLPDPLDMEGEISQFIGQNYAEHRFAYDD